MWNHTVLAMLTLLVGASPVAAEWTPAGPIKLMIGFRAGGGADTQGRLLAEELEVRRSWKIIPENVTGKGGANMARTLKGAPADGLTLGMTVTEVFSYIPIASLKAGYAATDFTYVTTTAPTQMGIVARADRGWKTLDDLVRAAKSGQILSISSMGPRLTDGAYYLAHHFGVTLNVVSVKGGKGSLNAILAGDVDAGWVAGIQGKAVASGDLVNLASGEAKRLTVSPHAPTLMEMGVPFDFGARFVLVAPAGLDPAAREAIAHAVTELVGDPASKTHRFIARAFGPPLLVSGQALEDVVAKEIADNEAMLKKLEN